MATKTFKIGLSNTDKQNMAQEVYKRLLALTFPEYNTTTSYDVGDFVVYNDQLYKCIGATSGAWDSSKWQLATLNDLLTDIEDAVAFVNDKANVDGNYPTMTVGVADQLSPYDDESGDDQDEPFNFQATGTGNGTQPDFSTGSIALMKEKQGNTVVVNQLINESAGSSSSYDITFTKSIDANGNIKVIANGTATGTAYLNLGSELTNLAGHKILIRGCPTGGSSSTYYIKDGYGNLHDTGNGVVITAGANFVVQIIINNGIVADNLTFNPIAIDLTQWFGSNDNIPADLLAHPENFFRYYQSSLAYNEGTLVNANSRYLKAVGRNQWDEEWELGTINTNTGENISYDGSIRSKNYIPVIPNVDYYAKVPSSGVLFFYDKDKNFISPLGTNGGTFTTPANCCYARFKIDSATSYQNNITISLYYEDESGYDQYYPYELLTNNDTGTETLRSAGEVSDIKLPSGEIKRNVGSVDLGTLEYYPNAQYGVYTTGLSSLAKVPASNSNKSNIVCSKFITTSLDILYNAGTSAGFVALAADGGLAFNTTLSTTDFKTAMDGVYLFYELAEPTTEQGTPYSENIVIDDFGSMDFSGTSGVPQGNLIFYPVDYKAFIDTLYDYTEGTPSNIALKSDLASDKSELQGVDTQLLNAIGGTLRQCLCVKETLDFDNTDFVDLGSLSWGKTSVFYTVFNQMSGEKGICSNFVVKTQNVDVNGTLQIRQTDKNIYFLFAGTEYENMTADQFKAAMKGVLLAYEKASE